jgi:hypothetical protein
MAGKGSAFGTDDGEPPAATRRRAPPPLSLPLPGDGAFDGIKVTRGSARVPNLLELSDDYGRGASD